MAHFTGSAVLLVACPRCGHKGMRMEADGTRDLTCLSCSHTVPGAGVPRSSPADGVPAVRAVA